MKLHFGKEYGLHYTSKEGVGTRVEVILPMNWNLNKSTEESIH
jgi:sensor histidine kinase YesM